MSELRKSNTDHSYFITLTIAGWIDVFTRARYCDILVENLKYCQQERSLDVFAYVIMPSHMHIVARSLKADLNFILKDFKTVTAKSIIKMIDTEAGESRREWLLHMFKYFAMHRKQNKHYLFWQKTNHPIELRTAAVIDQKIDCIHNNPVGAGLVVSPECWYYGSANENSPIEVLQT